MHTNGRIAWESQRWYLKNLSEFSAELFHQLAKALEILTDAAARVNFYTPLQMTSFCVDDAIYDCIIFILSNAFCTSINIWLAMHNLFCI